ncbi:MAG: Clp protease N-terminal domain-containing protein [Acidimicrobiales bacterium]|jgi:ATP-dependent Clp protease ATP-binding subunit ClpA
MFERFTRPARRVIVVSEEEARNLNHSLIRPEHLLLGLMQGDGLAAKALGQLGVSLEVARAKVAGSAGAKARNQGSKVPFSPEAKKALEMSLREALRLGHNYIGTEHLALGVLRVVDAGAVMQLLGVDGDEVRRRVLEVTPNGSASESPRSPAVVGTMWRARELAGSAPITTGQLLLAMLADDASQGSKALARLGVHAASLEAQLAQVPISGTSDAPPRPRAIEIKLGELTTTIDDPDLAAALGELSAEQLRAALRDAFGTSPEQRESGD